MEAVTRIKREICSTSRATGKKSRGKLLLPPERAAEGGVSSEVIQVRASGERMLEEQVGSGYEIPRAPALVSGAGQRSKMWGELGIWGFLP